MNKRYCLILSCLFYSWIITPQIILFNSTSIKCFGPKQKCLSAIDFDKMRKVCNIADAERVSMVAKFPEFQDFDAYGDLPNCLDIAHLRGLNSLVNWSEPSSYKIRSTNELYIAQIHLVFIDPSVLGTIFDDRQQLLFKLLVDPGNNMFWPVNPEKLKNFQVIELPKAASVQGARVFYHWLIDRFPSIFLLKEYILKDPEMKLIINTPDGHVAGYVHEYLDLLGIPRDKYLVTPATSCCYVETLYFATPFLMEPIPRKLLLALRDTLLESSMKYKLSRQYNNNLVVVIQRKESDLKIVNMPELLNYLTSMFSELNYEIFVFDASCSVAEQIQIFNNARVVIGVMASGLANVIFTKPGTSIIEMHPDYLQMIERNNYGNEWVWWLASAVGADYWILPTQFKIEPSALVTCPIEQLGTIIKKILIKQKSC